MKLLNKTSSPSHPSRSEALACTPVASQLIDCQTQEDGTFLLVYPLTIKPFFQSLLQRFNKNLAPQKVTKKLHLDAIGSKVWLMIDGEKNVKSIIEQFSKESSITLQESEISITAFIRELGKRGLITLH